MFFPSAQMSHMAHMAPMAMNSVAPFTHGMAQAGAGAMNVARAAGSSGGLLGRLFGGLGAGGGQSINLMSIIQNTQRVVGMVQTVTPMVQQYGPIIKNLPALYKIMKAAPSSDSTVTETTTTTTHTDSNIASNSSSDQVKDDITYVNETVTAKKLTKIEPDHATQSISRPMPNHQTKKGFKPKNINGIPAPKMYI